MTPTAILFAGVYASNYLFNIVNGTVAKVCPYVTLVVCVQLLIAAATSVGISALTHQQLAVEVTRDTFVAGGFHFFIHAFMAQAFASTSLATVHMTRALEPLLMACLEFSLYGKVLSRRRRTALLVVVVCVAACNRRDGFSPFGFSCAMVATVASCGKTLLLKTSHKGANHSGMQILAAVWSVPFALALDVPRLLLPRTTSEPNHWKDILPLVAVCGVFFGVYSWLGVATLQQVSPTSYSLGNTAKRAFLVLLLSWSEPVTVHVHLFIAENVEIGTLMLNDQRLAQELAAAVPSAECVARVSEHISRWVGSLQEQAAINTWFLQSRKATSEQLLAQVFIMNDVLQKLGPRTPSFKFKFLVLFAEVVFSLQQVAPGIVEQVTNVLGIWRKRVVYSKQAMDFLQSALNGDDRFRHGLSSYVQQEEEANYAGYIAEFREHEDLMGRQKLAKYYLTEVETCTSAEHDPRLSVAAFAKQCPMLLPQVAMACEFTLEGICDDVFLETSVINDRLRNETFVALPQEEAKFLAETVHLAKSLEQQWTSLMGKYDIGMKLAVNQQREQLKVLKSKEFGNRAKLQRTHLRAIRLFDSRYRYLICRLAQTAENIETVEKILGSKLQKGLARKSLSS
ncbi:MAG: uncharacterized protein KVP18_001531 [Porospora cf. gigantea A]|uniref:uncharacterized protein n=2 Tax=Porospora cf. gigantea A TaxID=2853593 RepID=UPI0035594DA9|nr:MAG: hypothetical protein KVP18_001531 [Porospora cf. gigantea A]